MYLHFYNSTWKIGKRPFGVLMVQSLKPGVASYLESRSKDSIRDFALQGLRICSGKRFEPASNCKTNPRAYVFCSHLAAMVCPPARPILGIFLPTLPILLTLCLTMFFSP